MNDLSRTATARSTRSSRSRRRRGDSVVSRVYSGQHLDDQTVYHEDEFHAEESFDEDEKSPIPEGREDEDSSSSDSLSSDEESHDGPTLENDAGIMTERDTDLERGPRENLEKTATRKSQRSQRDPKLVTWEGPDDPENPKNWSMKRKWAATFVVSCFTFISPVSSSMVAPALGTIAAEFNVKNEVESQLMLSVFILAYAVGPLFLGPLSEMFGRVKVLQLANLFYLAFNIACGVCTSKGQLIAFRFLSGLGGSVPLAVGGGVLSDCFKSDERGKAVAIYSLAPLLGPAVGPIAGGFITENTTWRWVFYATSIADAVIQTAGFFLLQETYAPQILKVKANKIRKETGDPSWHTEFESPDKTIFSILRVSMVRPFRLLATQPIVQALAVYMAYMYGLMYLMLATFPSLWTSPEYYNESIGIGGLNYISLGVGFFLASQTCAPLNDRIYRYLKIRNNGVGKPEFRTPLIVIAATLMPIGLFIYGWTAQYHTHWIGPNIGAAVFSAGVIIGFQCIQTYLVDSYTRFAASALAAATVLRSLAGFGFPLFAPYLYQALHYGWGNSLLAFIAIGIGGPAPFLLWKYGEKLRVLSPYAAGG
ncbi:MFS multidrug transporter [Paecilomyces variotii No. 5]|uniref:MFS multidrug transporter n=1 Tax=Byssochlamys spectabilis (strain No. 5 / NBRC 109023) TaxID=1356009 RepID=V5GB68_BYSSN|nr:MFS multidrug transporter [Paecilomyces variotii No. 5]